MKEQNRTNETRSVGTTTDAMRRRDGTLTIYTEIFILHLNKRVTVQKSVQPLTEVNTHQRRQSSSPSVSSQHYFNTRQQACPRLAASDRRIRYILFLMPLKVNFELFFLWLMTPDRSWSSPHKGFTKDEHFQLVLLLNNKRICGRHEFMSLN